MVTIQSPFCGYNLAYCVELKGEDLSCYLNNIWSVGLWKCPYDHELANKVHFNDITVKIISESFTHKTAAEASWHWNYITVTLWIKGITEEHVFGMAVRGRVTHWIFTKDTSWQNTGVNRVSSPSSIICWSRVQRNESKEVHIPYHIIHHATYMHTLFRIATSISSNSFVQKCSAVIYFDMEHNCGMTTYRSLV